MLIHSKLFFAFNLTLKINNNKRLMCLALNKKERKKERTNQPTKAQ
jgi:hypothetical protein